MEVIQTVEKSRENFTKVEYIWLDSKFNVRSKTRVLPNEEVHDAQVPKWSFDGSSTDQAVGSNSDLVLVPVRVTRYKDEDYLIALCEVKDKEGNAHETCHRSILKEIYADNLEFYCGFEQEYVFTSMKQPIAFIEELDPLLEKQGNYYCGVGDRLYKMDMIAEEHLNACLDANLQVCGINAEVLPGQWEFQIGYRGVDIENNSPLRVCDDLIIARWLLQKVASRYGFDVTFENKPVKGEWNGSGCHTNFSYKRFRNDDRRKHIDGVIEELGKTHEEDVWNLGGDDLEERLVGEYETSSMDTFSVGEADRGCSVRIPVKGDYVEDRRPGANCNPYIVVSTLVRAINRYENTK